MRIEPVILTPETMSTFELLYLLITGSLIVALGAALKQKWLIGYLVSTISTSLALFVYVLICVRAHRPPLFGIFESGITIVLVMNLLAFLNDYHVLRAGGLSRPKLSPSVWGANLALLLLMAFSQKTLNADFYMYDVLSVVIFFHFRIIAFSLFFYATVISWFRFFNKQMGYQRLSINFLLAGSVIFLISELSGSWWCLNWWGDTWHWSKGFFKSACVFMAVMLVCHLPPGWFVSKITNTLVRSIPAAITLWVMTVH